MSAPAITYRKGFVYADGRLVGAVKKVERWTVRGKPIDWEAWRKGRFLGTAPTRKEAAAILVEHSKR